MVGWGIQARQGAGRQAGWADIDVVGTTGRQNVPM